MGRGDPIAYVIHVRYIITLSFELDNPGAYRVVNDEDRWDVDKFILTADDDWHWRYTCWSRRETPASAFAASIND
jgi:hypothetical protein